VIVDFAENDKEDTNLIELFLVMHNRLLTPHWRRLCK